MQLSVIIVNYNVRYFLEQCLRTVIKAVSGVEAELIVVDNHSSDNSMQMLRPLFPDVQFIINEANLGFSRANNIALAACRGKYVLFLNPDTLVPENALKDCLAYLEGNMQTGAIGVRMIDGNGRFLPESKRSFPSPLASFFKLVGLAWVFPRSGFFNKYGLGNGDENQTQRVAVLAGACMLVRKEILDQLQGFDERYFMYGEDIDLSYRIQQLGFENHYFAGTTILHFKGASSRKGSMAYVRNFYGAMQIFVKQHYTRGAARIFRVLISLAISLRAMLAFLLRQALRVFTNGRGAELNNNNTLLVGSAEEYESVLPLLKDIRPRRVATGESIEDAACVLPDLALFCQQQNIAWVIFCEGSQQLTGILRYTELLADKKTGFLFHISGTHSIIGANRAPIIAGA